MCIGSALSELILQTFDSSLEALSLGGGFIFESVLGLRLQPTWIFIIRSESAAILWPLLAAIVSFTYEHSYLNSNKNSLFTNLLILLI